MQIKTFFDKPTWTLTYVVHDENTRDAVIIDPVLDLDTLAWRTSDDSAKQVMEYVRGESLNVRWILDTHAHADHITGMEVLKDAFGAPTGIGQEIKTVQQTFANLFNMKDIPTDGRQWDKLVTDGEVLDAGALKVEALHTPGHTPACYTYKIGDALFTGDALFMPDFGTGRCDFPAGSAEDLYDSITGKLYAQPDSTRIFVGHDYQPGGRELKYETTVGESKATNIQLPAGRSKSDFVTFRTERDAKLSPPRLILPSLQANIAAGALPEPEDNGKRYFKFPLNTLGM